jgi:hypothetical protein
MSVSVTHDPKIAQEKTPEAVGLSGVFTVGERPTGLSIQRGALCDQARGFGHEGFRRRANHCQFERLIGQNTPQNCEAHIVTE